LVEEGGKTTREGGREHFSKGAIGKDDYKPLLRKKTKGGKNIRNEATSEKTKKKPERLSIGGECDRYHSSV